MNTRTLRAPRFTDDYSFSGRGRWQTRRFEQAAPGSSSLVPVEPVRDVAVAPKEPRG